MPRRGPAPRASRAEVAAARAERRLRALEELLDVRLETARPYPRLEVRNPLRGTTYQVLLPEWPDRASALCTCTDFARRGLGTCKHLEAGVRWLREHPDAEPFRRAPEGVRGAVLWRRLDRRMAAARQETGPEARRWRRAGAVLFETPKEAG